MAEQAKVTSVDALESFRASLIVFLSDAHRCLDEVGDEVRRTRHWVQTDQRTFWEGELRRRGKILEAAETEFFGARLSSMREPSAQQRLAVHRAKAAVAEAEEKLRNIKAWNRNYDGATDPLLKRLNGLRQFLDFDLPKGVSFLTQAQRTLEDYTERAAPPPAPAPAGGTEEPA